MRNNDFHVMKNAFQAAFETVDYLSSWEKVQMLFLDSPAVLIIKMFIREIVTEEKTQWSDEIKLTGITAEMRKKRAEALTFAKELPVEVRNYLTSGKNFPEDLLHQTLIYNLKRAILASFVHFYVAHVDQARVPRTFDTMIKECQKICGYFNVAFPEKTIDLCEMNFFLAVELCKKAFAKFEEATNPAAAVKAVDKAFQKNVSKKYAENITFFGKGVRKISVYVDAARTFVSPKTKSFVDKMNDIFTAPQDDMTKAVNIFQLFKEEGLAGNASFIEAMKNAHILDENNKLHLPLFFSATSTPVMTLRSM